MFARLADAVVRRRRVILIAAVIGVALSGALGGGVADRLSTGGFEAPASESSRTDRALADRFFAAGSPDVVVLVTATSGTVDDPDVATAGQAITDEIAGSDGVEFAAGYWALGSPPPLASRDRTHALVLVGLTGTENERLLRAGELGDELAGTDGPIQVRVGGQYPVFNEINEIIEADLLKAEIIALPLTMLLLLVVFGSAVSALLPLAIAGLSVVGTFLILRIVASFTEVSIFALNLTTALGLGLAIDYSLLVVNRYREELDAGLDRHAAAARTIRTSGRTVFFSAMTVAASLAALLVFPFTFLKSFAYAGIAVVVLAAVGAVVVLPALLAVLGPNVDRWRVRPRRHIDVGEGRWHTVAVRVMRRPVAVTVLVSAFLIALGLPFLGIEFGIPDDRVLPPAARTRQVSEIVRTEFDSREATAMPVVALDIDPSARGDDIASYAAALSQVDGVARVDALTGSYIDGAALQLPEAVAASLRRFAGNDATYLNVIPGVEPVSQAGEDLARDIRATSAPFDVLVSGPSAYLLDSKQALFARMPLAGLIIAVVTFVVLFLSFGSILVPIKAFILNLLSLTATFGAMVWVFQDGHLSGVLDFTATGALVTTMPILMFCIAFGLSMDYEVFLLSRIKEEYDRTGDNEAAVAYGLEKTGRIVTAAAVLIAVVFSAFAFTGRVSFMKLNGFGLTLAVLIDAFLIRATLVPAFMKLAGGANWWAPAPMRRFYERFGFHEHDEPSVPEVASADERVLA